ncbi:MAG: tetratricopeptide repeat protein [Gemmatimonadota bacterium]
MLGLVGGSVEPGEPLESLVAQGTDNLEAYNAFLRGRYLAAERTPRGLEAAAEQFERAVALDPEYAEAWAELGMTNSLRRGWGFSADSAVERRGAEATERALELDPLMAEAHTARGYIFGYIHYDSAKAEQNFARAIELDPRYPTAYHWRGEVLGDNGHPESGIAHHPRGPGDRVRPGRTLAGCRAPVPGGPRARARLRTRVCRAVPARAGQWRCRSRGDGPAAIPGAHPGERTERHGLVDGHHALHGGRSDLRSPGASHGTVGP